MSDPWAFGWNQLLTLVGIFVTVLIAIGGFRSFNRWKREQLEARRIDVALEALSIAYESRMVFDHIRSPMAYEYEWRDMPERPGETEHDRSRRGSFYAVRRRVVERREFFERVVKIHPKLMAMFGAKAEQPFMQLHRARRDIEVAAEMLQEGATRSTPPRESHNEEFYRQLRGDIWAGAAKVTKEGDRVGKKLQEFQDGIEALCRPVIDRQYSRNQRPRLLPWLTE
jgi:hypothetical protein